MLVCALAYRRAAALYRMTGLSAEWPLSRLTVVVVVSAMKHGAVFFTCRLLR